MLLDRIILTCCSQFKDGRSVSAIFHLFKGKRSIQTVQDAHIYRLDRFYGIFKSLSKQDFDKHIHNLVTKKFLLLNENSSAIPTTLGYEWLKRNTNNFSLNYFNGMKYYSSTTIFFERLVLLIQTLTNSNNNNLNFIPVVDKPVITNWVKKEYYGTRLNQNSYLQTFHSELYELLYCLPEREASMFVDCLTGYKHYGMSSFQLADYYNLNRIDVPLILTGIIQQMLLTIEQDLRKYPLLTSIKKDLPEDTRLTNSANKTSELLNKQYAAEEIAVIRNLKLNTIYDHLVEIALYDEQFPLDKYVDTHSQQEILSVVKRIKSYKLKDIKQEINEEISYFQIRLVLAVENIS